MDLGDKVTGTEIVISEIAIVEPIAISEILTVEPIAIATPEMITRSCVECGATKTPLWRGGPAGPKSLCNACGIRGRKKKKALLGLNKDDKKMKKSGGIKKNQSCTSSSGESTNNNVRGAPPGSVSIHWTELGEVEQAAFMLMSLSCGSVYA